MKYLKIFLIFFAVFIFVSEVKADTCTYKEKQTLNKEASNIKINYEIVTQDLPEGYHLAEVGIEDENGNDVTDQFRDYFVGKYINIIVSNIPENYYFTIEDEDLINDNNSQKQFYYSDAVDNLIQLKLYDISEYKNIKFTVYSNQCTDALLTKYLKTPRYNSYSYMDICKGIEDYKYCQEFLMTNVKSTTIYNKILEYKESLNKKEEVQDNKSSKKIIILISCILGAIVLGVLIYIIVQRKLRWKK